ncbi:hypothetical protein F4777DRAFT_574353 [Nemania sp. FL0916]|nr:hypothetical protein F4777DRAFT_574353 [Nemania sp. FL0916]
MSDETSILEFRKTGDTEPQTLRLYIALFSMGSGSLCVGYAEAETSHHAGYSSHWGLVMKDNTGVVDLLDVNDLNGSKEHQIRNFNKIRKNHLKIMCEIADLRNHKNADLTRCVAADERIPGTDDRYFCRTWVVNVLESLAGHVGLYGQPAMIQRSVQHAAGEFDMQYGDVYHIVAPYGDRVRAWCDRAKI